MFEKIKKVSKKQHYSKLIIKHQSNIKKTWSIMKEIIGKKKIQTDQLPPRITVNGECKVANTFNRYFAEVGPNLAKNISKSNKCYKSYVQSTPSWLNSTELTYDEFETAFLSQKINKSPGYDGISSNIIQKCYSVINEPLFHIFKKSINTGIFPNVLKLANITPILKSGDESTLSNYRPISHKNIKTLFTSVNRELTNIQEWFNANKLSLNIKKPKYSLFHSSRKSDNMPLRLPKLEINGINIEREKVTKFLGVLLDENLSWKEHINSIKTNISKNIGLLYKARYFVTKKSLNQLYFSYINSYLTYANIIWGCTPQSNLIPLYGKQKHAIRAIYFEDKRSDAKPLLTSINALNVYQLNIFQTLIFMFKTKLKLVPNIFQNFFTEKETKYKLKSSGNYYVPFKKSKLSQFSISFRGPHLRNTFLKNETEIKNTSSLSFFKRKLKSLIMSTENITNYF